METLIDLRTEDGVTLRGTHYRGSGEHTIVISSAMAVKRRYYDAFARFAAEQGFDVVTFDFRGIGDSRPKSLRGFRAVLHDWGRFDLSAALDFVGRELAPRHLTLVAHSAGGQIAGLAPNIDRIDSMVFVSVQSGFWKHWKGIGRYKMHAVWLSMPIAARIFGYFPSRLFRFGGEDLPRGVALEWSQLGLHRDYIFGFVSEEERARYSRWAGPLMAWSFRDDPYAPRAAVDALLAGYSGARIERRHVDGQSVGHFGFFRRAAEPLWREAVQWIQGTRPP